MQLNNTLENWATSSFFFLILENARIMPFVYSNLAL